MQDTTVARSYATALFELGERHDAHDDFATGLNMLVQILERDATVRAFLETPKIDVRRKQDVLRRALEASVSPLFMNFMMVLLEKRRQRLLRAIARAYGELVDQKLGRLHVQVTLAHEPDEATERRIASELSRILGREAIPHVQVNPDLLGGIVVRYGDRIMDGSLRRRLLALRSRLVEAALPGQG